MRFYKNQHKYYCGIDLHSTCMYVCVLDEGGKIVFHRNMGTDGQAFLEAVEPYREDLVVGVECMYCWYWLADLCAEHNIRFVLGHALYMKAIHGGKAKNDKVDSEKIALLLRGGMFPEAYVYPKEMRATRDLMRRRLFFVRKRSELYAHIQMTYQQYNLPAPGVKLAYRSKRTQIEKPFSDDSTLQSVNADLEMVEHYSDMIKRLEWQIEKKAKKNNKNSLNIALLKTVPGIGPVLSATLLYEIHDIKRFPSVQHFASYARLVKPERSSAGKKTAGGGSKIGNQHLKWAFSEVAALCLKDNSNTKAYLQKLQRKHHKSKALTLLAHKLGRAVYHILLRKEPWDEAKFLKA